MTELQRFLKTVAVILAGSGLNMLLARKQVIKTGVIYENKEGHYFVTYYERPKDGCMCLKVLEFDKNYKEVNSDEYYSEDDVCNVFDLMDNVKESRLNSEVIAIFTDIVQYLKANDLKVTVN